MQPAQPLAIAVIGCGAHGRGHVLHFNELPEARVVAVADTERERARGVAEAFSVPHHYADYRDLLANHALDIVSLALPRPRIATRPSPPTWRKPKTSSRQPKPRTSC